MKILCQMNPLWRDKEIGNSNLKIGRVGCTITCLSMLTDYFSKFKGKYKSPDILAKQLEFTKDGLVLWNSVELTTQFKLYKRISGQSDTEILVSLKDPKKAVILQVQGNHWILCLGRSLFGGYSIADPWTGDKSTTRRYKNQITGSAHFILC